MIGPKKLKTVLGRVENTMGNGKKKTCWLTALSPFLTMFSNGIFLIVIKVGICGQRITQTILCFYC